MAARKFVSRRMATSAFAIVTALTMIASCGSTTSGDSASGDAVTSTQDPTSAATSDSSPSGADPTSSADETATDQPEESGDLAGHTVFPELEATAPIANKKLFVITWSMSLAGNVRQVEAVEEAADTVGWETVVVDADFDPSGVAAGIRRAVAEGADGLVLQAMDYGSNAAAIDNAREAGLKVVSIVAGNKAPEEVDYDVTYDQHAAGVMVADYIAEHSDGSASAIIMNDTAFTLVQNIVDGVTDGLEKCEKCSVADEVKFTADQVGPDFVGIVQTALARNPDAEWLVTPYGTIAIYARQAILSSSSKTKIISTGSDLVNYEYIADTDEGAQVASVDLPAEYLGYLAVYQLNRFFGDLPPFEVEVPLKAIDSTVLPPAGEAWTGDEPYRATFETAWGK